ncbi:carbamoyltransferase C-terminal domain-containing protein [Ectothiorhodospira sp. BSL-9]|uniref:carbamoyltransferase C-terminal domain-containing protein n=1 Tax=Ectothiorhodospira sp. BSL-9 TaxID=1442136 RepID=UPI0007B42C9D|nr:carbamoyltransferase C-terminal domain-containing protein [Ectothiorhodospira sp. BSL-9]ANB02035.1 hypothetical protein ECTOBSL9_1305 [Ectothiorhodospira sp. BSL-9]
MSQPQYILGINCAYHESAAALIADGELVMSVEEERLGGPKHGKVVRVDNADELPWRAINACLDAARIDWASITAVAYSLDPHLRQSHACLGTDGIPDCFGHPEGEALFQQSLARVPDELPLGERTDFVFVPHHEAHGWYAMGTSTFDEAAILVMDGIGEGATVSIGWGDRRSLHLDAQSFFPDSLGLAWEKVARFLDLTEYDASKVMALAGLAQGAGTDADHAVHSHLADALQVRDGRLIVDQDIFRLEYPDDFAGLRRRFGRQTRSQGPSIAHAIQHATETVLLELGQEIRQRYGSVNLAYGGGVALNCRANEKLARSGLFRSIHAGPASHDAGTALGAAWQVHTQLCQRPVPQQDAALVVFSGPRLHAEAPHTDAYRQNGLSSAKSVVQRLLAGDCAPWAIGRCEFGPRALGARSLLGPSWDRDIVQRINRLKGRYAYEPVALSVLAERADEMFDIPDSARSLVRTMLVTVSPRAIWQQRLAHLLHKDGSVRLQVVHAHLQPEFHELLRRLDMATGWPLVVNTSLNLRGEPMSATQAGVDRTILRLGLNTDSVKGFRLVSPRAGFESGDCHTQATSTAGVAVATSVS